MATIKSYTDLEQSKKLAEILPLESADGILCEYEDGSWHYEEWTNKPVISRHEQICWSLAALLDVFPPYLFEFERGIDLNIYPHLNGKGWHCGYMPNCIENMKTDKFKLITSGDSLVDACYEMILKLNDLNLL